MTLIDPARLIFQLQNTGVQQKDTPMYQFLYSIIGVLSGLNAAAGAISTAGGSSSVTNVLGFPPLSLEDGGEEGAIGPPGLTGATGATGQSGAIGPSGLDGDAGEDAIVIPGPTGATGPAGPSGTSSSSSGFPGLDGQDGEDSLMIPGPIGPAGPMVPYYIAPTETFTVPIYKQALFAETIDMEGYLEIFGDLILVNGAASSALQQLQNIIFEENYSEEINRNSEVTLGGTNVFQGPNSFLVNPLNLVVGQLKFPATQNISADPNTLDDYEEGNWTPTLTFGGASTGITYSGTGQNGSYVKIGAFVFVTFRLELTSKGSSTGQALINGLPFANSSTKYGLIAGSGSYVNMAGLIAGITGAVDLSANTLTLQAGSAAGVSNLTDANFTNTTVIITGAVYRVDS